VQLVLLERDAPAVGRRHGGDAGDEPRRLEADAELVAVVLPRDRGAVDAAADLGAQQGAGLGDAAGLLAGVRVVDHPPDRTGPSGRRRAEFARG
jgi:hypothetical protein